MSIKEVSDELILIAYADKIDRYSLVQDLKSKLDNIPTSEIQETEKVLILGILDDILEEVQEVTKPKVVAKKPKKETEIVVEEPEIIVEKPNIPVISQPQPTIETPKPIEEDLSFLDDIDSAF
jgi:hypothetical protein